MAAFKHDWPALDPHIDRLKRDGLDASAIARELKIPRKTLTDHRPDLRKDAGSSQVPAKVLRQVPKQVPHRYPSSTHEPLDLDALADALKGRMLDAFQPALQAWLSQQVPGQVPLRVPMQVLEEIPGATAGEYPTGTSGYPPDPARKDQFHWHLPKGELWELRAVADGLQMDKSLLLRKLWRAFMKTPEAQASLQRYLSGSGTPPDTQAGTS